MRLAVLFICAAAALISTPALAVPVGYYNPATGGVSFSNLSDVVLLDLYSSVPLAKGNALGPVDPTRFVGNPNAIAWNTHPNPIGADFFAGNLVVPGTPLLQLSFDWLSDQRSPVKGTMLQIPEPSSLAICAMTTFSLAALRRRK
jgi:hypothetical protein